MYLWKYWRESRIVFGIGLLIVALLFALVTRGHMSMDGTNGPLSQIAGLVVVLFYVQILPLGFFAWLLGSYGIGRDLGEGSGSFLFTRPRRRAQFVWSDWGFGIGQVILITILSNLAIWVLAHRLLLAAGDPFAGSLPFPTAAQLVPLSALVVMSATGGILIAGLVFSVTYASTVVVRHARGVMLSIGLFVAYLVVGAVIHHYWEAVTFPSLLFQAFDFSGHNPHGLNPHPALEILARSALILLFPVVAQLSLDRSDL